jgi:hypothetical protein
VLSFELTQSPKGKVPMFAGPTVLYASTLTRALKPKLQRLPGCRATRSSPVVDIQFEPQGGRA